MSNFFGDAHDLLTLQKAIKRFEDFRRDNPLDKENSFKRRIWLVSNFSTEFLAGGLPPALYDRGISASVNNAPYNQWRQILIDSSHPALKRDTDIVLLLLSSMQLAYSGELTAERVAGMIISTVTTAASHTQARIVIVLPEPLSEETSDMCWAYGWRQELNGRLKEGLSNPQFLLLDIEPLVRVVGAASWYADRFYVGMKLPWHPNHLPRVINYLADVLRSLVVTPCKLVITDLDDTLWGGVIGDDSTHGIQLDPGGSGLPYLKLQRFLKELRQKGILLAIASRNDPQTALEAFRLRPEMILSESDFAAIEIGWGLKSESITRILQKLNLTTTGVIFLDDNPQQRLEVKTSLPEIIVPDLPNDATQWASFLADSGLFTVSTETAEDTKRTEYYQAEQNREKARLQKISNPEEYLSDLEMKLTVYPVADHMDRVIDLLGKTNQFNLTTRRHSASELRQMLEKEGWGRCFRLEDKYGDYGIISVVILVPAADPDERLIDSWVMSCRAMGRKVENAVLKVLVQECQANGVRALIGEYLPTKKNHPVSNLFSQFGFERTDNTDTSERFRLNLEAVNPESFASGPLAFYLEVTGK